MHKIVHIKLGLWLLDWNFTFVVPCMEKEKKNHYLKDKGVK